jgi:hypothetical protein
MKHALPGVGKLIAAAAAAYTDDPQAPSRRVTAEFGWPAVF